MYTCMYVCMYVHRMGMYTGVYVCMQDSGSVRENPFHPWSPCNVRSAPLTKRLRNTVGTAKTKADVALPIHGFFTNILGKGSEVSSKHLEVPAFALIMFNVPPSFKPNVTKVGSSGCSPDRMLPETERYQGGSGGCSPDRMLLETQRNQKWQRWRLA